MNELMNFGGQGDQLGRVEQSRAIAETLGKMQAAKMFPRNEDASMASIQKECSRKKLAEMATYEFPRGDSTVRGASIRLAEVLARYWGNINCGVTILERKQNESIVKAYAFDLETNFSDERIFTVLHERVTKSGTYKLTNPRDIDELIQNQGARKKRACILSVIPGWVTDEALDLCSKTLEGEYNKGDIEKRKQDMLEKFKELAEWIDEKVLSEKIGKAFDKFNAKDMVRLGNLYMTIHDGLVSADKVFGRSNGAEEAGLDTEDEEKFDALNELIRDSQEEAQ